MPASRSVGLAVWRLPKPYYVCKSDSESHPLVSRYQFTHTGKVELSYIILACEETHECFWIMLCGFRAIDLDELRVASDIPFPLQSARVNRRLRTDSGCSDHYENSSVV